MNSSVRLEELHRKFQEDPRRYFAPLANELRKSGDARRAVELCREQLVQRPGHLSGNVVLALALHDLGARDEAQRAYQEALQLDPENVLVLRSLGDLARESGDPATARDWYERAMGVDPRDPEVARRLAGLERERDEDAPSTGADGLSFTAALAAAEARHHDEPADAARASVEEPPTVEVERASIESSTTQPVVDEGWTWDLADVAPAAPDDAPAPEPYRDEVSASVHGPADPRHDDARDEEADHTEEFTAGFFAGVVDAPAPAESLPAESAPAEADAAGSGDVHGGAVEAAPRMDGMGGDIGLDAEVALHGDIYYGAPAADATGEVSASGTDDMDRLFAELEPVTDETLDEGRRDKAGSLGTELAIADGGAVAPELPSLDELDELPTLEVYHDAGELEEVPAESAAPSLDEAPADEGPVPLVADEWTMSLDSIGFQPEPMDYSATSEPSAPTEPGPAFVTETMAQLYLQQGLTRQALDVYRQLAAQRPDEERLRDRVAGLERQVETEQGAARAANGAPPVAPSDEPPAVSWLRRLATARPSQAAMPVVPTGTEAPGVPEEPVIAPAGEPVAPDAPVFEWASPEPEAETTADVEAAEEPMELPDMELRDVELHEAELPEGELPEVELHEAELHEVESPGAEPLFAEDDPWIFDGERMAAADVLPADDTAVAPAQQRAEGPVAEPEPTPERALTLDELFARDVPAAEEQAAGALAAATLSMQDDPAVNAQLGEAAVEDPSSLLHVLRGTPRSVAALRQGASFSFDQFFRVDEPGPAPSEGGTTEGQGGASGQDAGAADAGARSEEAESDLADFHAWLSGLSRS
ncbi:MAG TPA: tetratricopeptide repeat protein [Gemmatimonadales bacterium]